MRLGDQPDRLLSYIYPIASLSAASLGLLLAELQALLDLWTYLSCQGDSANFSANSFIVKCDRFLLMWYTTAKISR